MNSITRAPRRLKRRTQPAQGTTTPVTHAARKGQNPLVLAIAGVAIVGLWLGLSLFQIQTTESWTLNAPPPDIAGVSWGVVFQAGQLVSGQLAGALGKAVAVGWSVEIITLVFGVALEVAAHGVGRSSQMLRGIFVFGGFGLLIFNGWTDYAYGSLPSGACGQFFFAGLMSFIVVFGLPAGLELLLRAKDEFTR